MPRNNPPSTAPLPLENPISKVQAGRPRSTDVDQRILKETLDVISEKGFSGVTINEICSRAGISRATFYRRYPSPAEALADAINANFKFDAFPHSQDPVEYLLEFVQSMETSYSDPRIAPAIGFLISECNAKPNVYARLLAGVSERRAHVHSALTTAGIMSEPPPHINLEEILIILSSLAWNASVTRRKLDPDVIRTVITRLIL